MEIPVAHRLKFGTSYICNYIQAQGPVSFQKSFTISAKKANSYYDGEAFCLLPRMGQNCLQKQGYRWDSERSVSGPMLNCGRIYRLRLCD